MKKNEHQEELTLKILLKIFTETLHGVYIVTVQILRVDLIQFSSNTNKP